MCVLKKFYGPNEPKYGPIKALNLHRDQKGDQRWTKQPERKKNRLNFRLSTLTVEHKRSPIFYGRQFGRVNEPQWQQEFFGCNCASLKKHEL